MPLLANAQMTVASAPGTGSVSLGVAAAGARTWAAAGAVNGFLYSYRMEEGGSWEIGIGTYSSGAVLARTYIIASSNNNSAVSFGAATVVSQVVLPEDIQAPLGFTPVQQGTGSGQASNVVKIGWTPDAKLKITVDAYDLGEVFTEASAPGAIASDGNYSIQRFPCGLMEAQGSTVLVLDANGNGTINCGATASQGVWLSQATNGDFGVSGSYCNTGFNTDTGFRVQFYNSANTTVRVNWRAWARWR